MRLFRRRSADGGRKASTKAGSTGSAGQEPEPFDVAAWVDNLVDQGFLARHELVATATEFLDDQPELGVDPAMAAVLVDDAIARHREAQASWPAVTDNDRLDRTFAALEQTGIVARQNFACCMSCGFTEIGDEIRDRAATQGFVFYHGQDTERAADGGGVYLAYGALAGGDAAAQAIGRRVVDALVAEGLQPAWNGSVETRIALPLEWKRRRID
jgi:uncharacterized protein DUF6891